MQADKRQILSHREQEVWSQLLSKAVTAGDIQAVKRLRARRSSHAPLAHWTAQDLALLRLACSTCQWGMAKFFLNGRGARALVQGPHNLLACIMEHSSESDPAMLAVARLLITKGAKVQDQEFQLLLYACQERKRLALLQLLLKLNVSITRQANGGQCPLVTACSCNNWSAARALVRQYAPRVHARYKALFNGTDKQGMTPLMFASQASQTTLVDMLLKRGANPLAVNHLGLRADQMSGCDEVSQVLQVFAKPQKSVNEVAQAHEDTDCVFTARDIPKLHKPNFWWAKYKAKLQQRLVRLQLGFLAHKVLDSEIPNGVQQQAYLGNNEHLLQHMRSESMTTMTRKQVRTWLEQHGRLPAGYVEAGMTLSDCAIDHVLPVCLGGQDHPYNYVIIPKKVNGSLGGWYTAEKELYIGKNTVRTVKNMLAWARQEGNRLGVNYNNFHQVRYSM